MSRFASGAIVGFLLGGLVVVVLAGGSGDGTAGHFKLPLKLELEFGEPTARENHGPAASVSVSDSSTELEEASIPADFQSILEQRQVCGSALAGTMLEINCPDDSLNADFVAALENVAAAEAHTTVPPAREIASFHVEGASVPSPLEASVAELYRQAEQCEFSCDFERADRFRRLAREIRGEIADLHNAAETPITTADTRADEGYPLD